MDLFDHAMKERMKDEALPAARMRPVSAFLMPRTLNEYSALHQKKTILFVKFVYWWRWVDG